MNAKIKNNRPINTIFWLLDKIGVNYLLAKLFKQQIVFTYHNIIPETLLDNRISDRLSITSQELHRHIKIFKNIRKVSINISHDKTIMITFDDGLRNNFEIAKEVLDSHHVKAVFFVPLFPLKCEGRPWQDSIFLFSDFAGKGSYSIGGFHFSIDDGTSRQQVASRMIEMGDTSRSVRRKIILDIEEWLDRNHLEVPTRYFSLRYKMMDATQLEILRKEGHLIAAHSARHERLALLSSSELKEDLDLCEAEVNKIYNCRLFAYPVGGIADVSPDVEKACNQSGFSHAFINLPRRPRHLRSRNFSLPRQFISPGTPDYIIRSKASGLENLVRDIFHFFGLLN